MEAFLILSIIAVAIFFILICWGCYEKGRRDGWDDRSRQYISPQSLEKIQRNPEQYKIGE